MTKQPLILLISYLLALSAPIRYICTPSARGAYDDPRHPHTNFTTNLAVHIELSTNSSLLSV